MKKTLLFYVSILLISICNVMDSSARSGITVSKKRIIDLNYSDIILKATTVKGKVVDSETGKGIPGVTVLIKGTKKAVSTDDNGNFQINVDSPRDILVFSFIGFETSEFAVGNRTTLNLSLQPSNTTLNEIVVVGFGKQKKINNTGAISSISTKALVQSPVANLSNSLAGRLTGVVAVQGGGEPGNDGSKIRIRGVGTYSGNSDPLVLVDGIQIDNFNNIDPNEIEALTVLKDASSTAVYGIRGANGVIIITTKRGKTGPPKISYTFNQAVNSFTDMRETMNSADYATNFNNALKADVYLTGTAYVPKFTDEEIEKFRNGTDPVFYPNMNWPDLLFKKFALQSQHNLNISGGSEKTKYFVSAGFFNQEGLFNETNTVTDAFSPQSTFKRYNVRSNFNFELNNRLKMTLDLSSQTEVRSGNNGTSERIVGDVFRASPLSSPGIVDGKLVNRVLGENNPYTSLYGGGLRRSYRNYLNGSVRFDYDMSFITKGLSAHANVAIQTYNTQQIANSKTLITYLALRLPDNSINYAPSATEAVFGFSQSGTYNRRITAESGIDYKRSFDKHNVTALLLYNQQKTYDPTFDFYIPKGYQSYVGRATYDYDGRYLAEINVGYNGTENFAPGKRFGYFPAYSLGWIASQESFFPKNGLVTFLKFRGSYGEVGNDNIGGIRFLYRPTSYNTFNAYNFGNVGSTSGLVVGIREGVAGNEDVTWERAVKRNVGFEMNAFKDKLKIVADLFDEYRSGILSQPRTISNISGISQPNTNLGIMKNKGYELEATFVDKVGEVGYRISGNYSFARNKIIYNDEVPNVYSYQNRTGMPFNQNFGLIAEGLYNTLEEVNDPTRPVYAVGNNKIQPGDIRYKDVNGDGKIDNFDQVAIGFNRVPEIVFGLSLGLNYKGFDASALFQGATHVSHYYSRFQANAGYNQSPQEGSAAYLNESWTPERYAQGLPINFPRFSAQLNNNPNGQTSSFWLADASYVRLKNVEIGYKFDNNTLRRLGISSFRWYVNANNLITWSNMLPGIDPENSIDVQGQEEPYPLTRTINTGVNINF